MVIPSSQRRPGHGRVPAVFQCKVGPRMFFLLGLIGIFFQGYFLLHHANAPNAPNVPSSRRPSNENKQSNSNNNPSGGQKSKQADNSTNQLAKALARVRKSAGIPPPATEKEESIVRDPKLVMAIAPLAVNTSNVLDNPPIAADDKAKLPPLVPLPIVKQKNGIRVGYAVSLVKCGDFQSSSAGLIDASLVMRHSIHLTHLQSKYDYKMYAIVHKQAEPCSQILRDVGFETIVVNQPVNAAQIRGEYLRNNIHKEWCCGEQEFVKLFAYTLPDPIIVHVDIDFAFLRPIDDLFDAIIYDKDSPEGKAARSRIPLERPEEGFPDKIEAFLTRDWPQVAPGRKSMYQAGFLVARRNPQILQEVVDVILEGNYTEGFGRDNGWGGAGYGSMVGAMAMQGLMAYFYDMVRPNTAVELNQCRFNHMGMDVLYRNHPNFRRRHPKVGKCRNDRDYCEDCTVTKFELIHNVHYTQCRKPWNCVGIGAPSGTTPEAKKQGIKANAIDTNSGNFDHCMELVTRWHEIRSDFENKLFSITNDDKIHKGQSGKHKFEYFQGHCTEEGGNNYLEISASNSSMLRVAELYQ